MGVKFNAPMSRLLQLSVAALIILSAAVVSEEPRRCYWCGPLADQVHRSRRAPPCDAPTNQKADCDAGLSYCAIVATAPPYFESRYCVKKYQDECFAIYCNTSRTWKMTCPCKGDLCNGANTDREVEAFTILSKLVDKTRNKRISKRAGQPIKSCTHCQTGIIRTQIVTNSSILNDNLINRTFVDTYGNGNELTEIIINSNEVISNVAGNLENALESTEETITQENTGMEYPDRTTGDIRTTVVTKNITEVTNVVLDSTVESQLITKMQNQAEVSQLIKPKEELPTAEALQQTASPISLNEKTEEPSTANYESITLTTLASDEKITMQPKQSKNGTITISCNVFFLIIISLIIW